MQSTHTTTTTTRLCPRTGIKKRCSRINVLWRFDTTFDEAPWRCLWAPWLYLLCRTSKLFGVNRAQTLFPNSEETPRLRFAYHSIRYHFTSVLVVVVFRSVLGIYGRGNDFRLFVQYFISIIIRPIHWYTCIHTHTRARLVTRMCIQQPTDRTLIHNEPKKEEKMNIKKQTTV